MRAVLTDQEDRSKTLTVDVELINGSLVFSAEGYGDKTSMPGSGSPLLIELCDGDLRVALWPDINKEDAQIISLDGARDELSLDSE